MCMGLFLWLLSQYICCWYLVRILIFICLFCIFLLCWMCLSTLRIFWWILWCEGLCKHHNHQWISPCLFALAKSSSAILNKNGENRQICLFFSFCLILGKMLWLSLHLVRYCLWVCCMLSSLCGDMSPVSLGFSVLLTWSDVGLCKRLFLHLMRWCCSLYLWAYLHSRYIYSFL